MEQPSLIFIPDISGFTKFVTETEIQHSNHIIKELIEIIIESNDTGLVISEIEGDAILFYRTGDPPALGKIIQQSKNMFLNFHTHLKIIERDNVCQCGACTSASKLTLKFISHFGIINETKIQNFNKIMGKDVILVHRLLKNNVPQDEYLLLTDAYWNQAKTPKKFDEDWIEFRDNTELVDNFGEIQTKYLSLTSLKKNIPFDSRPKKIIAGLKDSDLTVKIHAPLLFVHKILIDNNKKIEWVPKLKSVQNSTPLNRINSIHKCIFEEREIDFLTINNEVSENEIVYSEMINAGFDITFITDYILNKADESTEIYIQFRFENKDEPAQSFFNRIKYFLLEKKLKRATKKNMKLFKAYCEKAYIS